MAHGPIEWHAIVIKHYGSIEAFGDARSVCTMLKMCADYVKGINDCGATIKNLEARKEFLEIFKGDVAAHAALANELMGWLTTRNLSE